MSKELLSTVLRVVKLPLYYMLYQGVFSVVAMIVAFCVAIASGLITQEMLLAGDSAAVMSALPQSYMVWAISGGLFVSAAFMLWHLIFWGYFSFGKEPFRQVSGKVMLLCVLLIFASMFAFNILAEELGLPDTLAETLQQVSNNVLGCVSIAVLAPILEEVLFRGAIQGYLMRKYNPTVGIVVASAIFGLIHMNPIQIFYAFFLGLIFGWIYYRTRSLMPVVIGHVLNNSLAAASMILAGAEEEEEALMSTAEKGAIVLAAVVAAFVLMRLIGRMLPAVPKPWRGVGECEPEGCENI